MIYLGSPSTFFGKIVISEHVLTRYNRRFAKKCIDFPRFFAIRSIFRSKSLIFLLPIRIASLTLSEAFRCWKSYVFAKRHLDVEISWLLDDFSRVPIDVFSEKSWFRTMFWRVPGDDLRNNASIFRYFSGSGAFFDQNRRFFNHSFLQSDI